MPRDRAAIAKIDEAAAALTACSRAYTRANLYHCWQRLSGSDETLKGFVRGPLAARLARGNLDGLLPASQRWDGARLPREWDAYFPKVILIVDRPAILDLFIASGVVTTARLAVVCVDGSPSNVVDWLRDGFRAGHRAPVGYLHDAATAFYPFSIEPLASLIAVSNGAPIDYVDLGLPVRGALARGFPRAGDGATDPFASDARSGERIVALEALTPYAMIAYATRRLMAMVPGDPRMAPLVRPTKASKERRRS